MSGRTEREVRRSVTESDHPCAPTFRIGRWRVDAARPGEPGAGLWLGAVLRLLRSDVPVDAGEFAEMRRGLALETAELARELGLTEAFVLRLERDEELLEPWLRLALEAYVLRRCLPSPPIGVREGVFESETPAV